MPVDLTSAHAVVTGGASGIGAAIAQALAGAGAHVVVADLDGEAAAEVADPIGGEVWQVDLSKPAELDDLRLTADILVNNAGVQTVSPVEDFDPARRRFIVDLMLVAPFQLARAALPGMYERGWGRVINVSPVRGLRASDYKSAYVAAKHGLEGLSKTIALEGGGRGEAPRRARRGGGPRPLAHRRHRRHGQRRELHDGRRMDGEVIRDFQIPVDGGHLAVAEHGPTDGIPVLAIHGITASSRSWPALARLLPDVRLIAPDLRGRARSNDLPGPFGLPQHRDDMRAILDALDLDRVVVVGH